MIDIVSLGFAAGVMLAASYWSLLEPALEMAAGMGTYGDRGQWAFLPVSVGVFLGAGFVYAGGPQQVCLSRVITYPPSSRPGHLPPGHLQSSAPGGQGGGGLRVPGSCSARGQTLLHQRGAAAENQAGGRGH